MIPPWKGPQGHREVVGPVSHDDLLRDIGERKGNGMVTSLRTLSWMLLNAQHKWYRMLRGTRCDFHLSQIQPWTLNT